MKRIKGNFRYFVPIPNKNNSGWYYEETIVKKFTALELGKLWNIEIVKSLSK